MPRSPRSPGLPQQTSQVVPANQTLDSTFISPPPSPLQSNLTRKADHSAQFRYEFQSLIQNNKHAKRKWTQFQKKYKAYCTNKRCIKLLLSFCTHYGLEFESLSKQGSYRKLGSRSNCHCSMTSPLAPALLPPLTPVAPLSPAGPLSPASPLSPMSPLPPASPVSHLVPSSPDSLPFGFMAESPQRISPQFQSTSSPSLWPNPRSPMYMSFIPSPQLPQLPQQSQQHITMPPMLYSRPRSATFPCYSPLNLAYIPPPSSQSPLPHFIPPTTR